MTYDSIRSFALSLPESSEAPHHHMNSFRVRGKIFVTVPPDQDHLHVFLGELERERAFTLYPHFIEKLLWGGKVAGLRVRLEKADANVVKSLVRQAWANKAPKSLRATSE